MSRQCRLPATIPWLILCLAACSPGTDSTGDPSSDPLANTTYRGIYDDPVRLNDGRWEGEPFVPGAASRPTLHLLDEPRATGDLDGDGSDEAVVLLAENSGGSGVFIYLAVVSSPTGAPENLATRLLGDRVQVSSLAVEGGRIRLQLAERAAVETGGAIDLELILENGALIGPEATTRDKTVTLRGLLVWGHEVRTFAECGSGTVSWFIDATGGGVRSIYEPLATEPYEPLLFEVIGTFGPAPETGFGSEYGRTLTIQDVVGATQGRCDD